MLSPDASYNVTVVLIQTPPSLESRPGQVVHGVLPLKAGDSGSPESRAVAVALGLGSSLLTELCSLTESPAVGAPRALCPNGTGSHAPPWPHALPRPVLDSTPPFPKASSTSQEPSPGED